MLLQAFASISGSCAACDWLRVGMSSSTMVRRQCTFQEKSEEVHMSSAPLLGRGSASATSVSSQRLSSSTCCMCATLNMPMSNMQMK